jgi:uncharacterized membrane protein
VKFFLSNSNPKFFLSTTFAVIGIDTLSFIPHNYLVTQNAIATEASVDVSLSQKTPQLIAKKSGGRSGGGSFKSRSSNSSSSSKRKSFDSGDRYYRHRTSTYYHHGYHSYRGGFFSFISFILFLFLLLIILAIILAVFKAMPKLNAKSTATNDRVTIAKLQVALTSSSSEGIRQELSELSLNADTTTNSGLQALMKESLLILLRHSDSWHSVLSSSESLQIDRAESVFAEISLLERSKFSSETLNNVDGKIKTKSNTNTNLDLLGYIVVTLILGTEHDRPIFANTIYNYEGLKQALLKLNSIEDNYLIKFELLWTPQIEGEYLTDEEFLLEYTDMKPLV